MPLPFGAILGGIGAASQLIGARPSGYDDKRQKELRDAADRQRRMLGQMQQGTGPSVGRQMLQSGAQAAMNQQRAMAASARGGPLQQRLAQRTAQMAGSQAAGQAAQAAARLGAQEQLQATQQLGQNIQQQQLQNLRNQQARGRGQTRRSDFVGNVLGGFMETLQDPYLNNGNS